MLKSIIFEINKNIKNGIDDILEMDPESNYIIHHELTQNWKIYL